MSELSSNKNLEQPAYTEAFMTAIATSVTGIDIAKYPQPNGYRVYVSSRNGIQDNTSDVIVYNLDDKIQNGAEVTSVSFIAIFKTMSQYSFDTVSLYTQLNGSDLLNVAQFVLTDTIDKKDNYVLVLQITLSITTPVYVYNPIQDVLQLCSSKCSGVNCDEVASLIYATSLPFSPFNLVFLYLLGITVQQIEQVSNVSQLAQQYAKCNSNCVKYCSSGNLIMCVICFVNCLVYLTQYPLFVYTVSQNIENLAQLLPSGLGTVYAVNVCVGSVGQIKPNLKSSTINVSSPTDVRYYVRFYLPGIGNMFNALEVTLMTPAGTPYALGVLYFLGIPLPTGEEFMLEVSVSQ